MRLRREIKLKTNSSIFVAAPVGSPADQGAFLWAGFHVSLFKASNQGEPWNLQFSIINIQCPILGKRPRSLLSLWLQPALCLILPKRCLGNIYSVHSGFPQWISPQSLSPCLRSKPWTFSTWLNCKCPAHGLDQLSNGSVRCSPYVQVSSWHTSALEGDCTQTSPRGALSQELFTQFILRPSLRDLENNNQQDPFHVLPFLLLSCHFLQE